MIVGQAWAEPTVPKSVTAARMQGLLWREPTDISTRDLLNGPGGPQRRSKGRLTFWQCTQSNHVLEHIPLADVAWIAGWLSRLSQEQIADAFRAASYPPAEVAMLSSAVHERIMALGGLPSGHK